ncbi:AraC family transcriptional regulator [Maritalea sp.]|uniref:AraC family transcriptional regulator n=1 Tax=Maritalea sp. TaxID=2003361 RepID=UPI0039E5E6C4
MGRAKPNLAKGLIEKHISLQHFDLTLVMPSEALAHVVANYWIIEWDLPAGRGHAQENLPHPSQHLVLDPQYQSGVFGLTSGAFTYNLQGKGRIFGVKFHPGQFKRFATHDMRHLTDNSVPIASYFDIDDHELLQQFSSIEHCSDFAPEIEQVLLACEIVDDPKANLAREVVAFIEQNREIYEVAVVAQHFHVSPRGLQRLFAEYVGIGPKWVIERYRMIEAIEALNNSANISLTELSHLLGYFDQAHFSKAFKRLTGRSPSEIGLPRN